jgi:small GTP-binding protein
MDLLRIATCGSVDDGKSTLIGRLLYEGKRSSRTSSSRSSTTSKRRGDERREPRAAHRRPAAEREQGITIDVAYRYFATPKRKFIIADTPGHVQYTRNMVTGASTADARIILVDARNGVLEQTRRHAFIASLLGIPHVVVAINKMDLVDYDEDRLTSEIVADFEDFAQARRGRHDSFIPMSALEGDNVVTRSEQHAVVPGPGAAAPPRDRAHRVSDRNLIDCRFPVQWVIRPQSDEQGLPGYRDYRGYAGTGRRPGRLQARGATRSTSRCPAAESARLLLPDRRAGRLLRVGDGGVVDEVPAAGASEQALFQPRVVGDVVGEALAHHETSERLGSGVVQDVGGAPRRESDEGPGLDLERLVVQRHRASAGEDVHALVLVVVDVHLRRLGAGRNLDEMNAEPGETRQVAQGPVGAATVRVQEVNLVGAGVLGEGRGAEHEGAKVGVAGHGPNMALRRAGPNSIAANTGFSRSLPAGWQLRESNYGQPDDGYDSKDHLSRRQRDGARTSRSDGVGSRRSRALDAFLEEHPEETGRDLGAVVQSRHPGPG